MKRASASYLQRVYEAIWRRLGASDEEAEICARDLVRADVAGKETQGIACLPMICARARRGAIRFRTSIRVVKDGPATAVVDGRWGPGQVVATKAMALAIQRAREATLGAVWVRNTNVFTMASNYSTMALEHDYFGLATCNGVPLVAPWGGRDPVFNTSPLSFAIPAGKERPIVFDGSMSPVSHGRVVLSARDGRRMPERPLVDEAGRVTDDPVPLVVDPSDRNSPLRGAILALGPKGFAWLVLVDVLAGLMSGMSTAREVPSIQSSDARWCGGLFLLAINVGALVDLDAFKAKVDALIRSVKTGRLAEGFSEIVLPGERAARERERRTREGVPLRDEDWRAVAGIAEDLGVDLEEIRAHSRDAMAP
jgi:LDH2 family malate/lactate/ureidoglycolate dehydrogenase